MAFFARRLNLNRWLQDKESRHTELDAALTGIVMKTRAMDKTVSRVRPCLYDFADLRPREGYPSSQQFEVVYTEDRREAGIKTKVAFDRQRRLCKVSGHALGERRLHTLQISPRIHLHDPWFSGLITHSCNPNVFLDTSYLELWSVQAIAAKTLLTMDYATTEDVLLQQFACQCGADNCRGWITGSQEHWNLEGVKFMAHWHAKKSR